MEKYLDYDGLIHLWNKLSMEDYPNNEVLMAVINAIDQSKLDKDTYEAENIDVPRVYIDGTLPTTKDDLNAELTYVSKDETFHAYITIKCQGTSSMSYPKKNFTVKLFQDAEHTSKLKKNLNGWGKQNKFCLKANYMDCTHARNIVCAKLWGQACETRDDFNERLAAAPNKGAIDGFHIKLYANGVYQGLYTWNIPKDGWLFDMDSNGNEAIYCCEVQSAGGQFRQEVAVDGSDWSLEYPDEDEVNSSVKEGFNNFVNFVMNADNSEFISSIGNYLDINQAIDYYLYCYYFCALDQLGKNMIMVTYDGGQKWIPSVYDNDTTWGSYWDGTSMVSYDYQCPEQYECSGSLLWERIEELFGEQLYTRYVELTDNGGPWSISNIITTLEEFYNIPRHELYAEDVEIYTEIPQTVSLSKMRTFMANRKGYVDTCLAEIGLVITMDSIKFAKDSYTLGPGESIRIKLVYSPSNANDADLSFTSSYVSLEKDGNFVIITAPEEIAENAEAELIVNCQNVSDTMTLYLSPEATYTHKAPYISFDSEDYADGQWIDKNNNVAMNFSAAPTVSKYGVFFDGNKTFNFANTRTGDQDLTIEFLGTLEDNNSGHNILAVGATDTPQWADIAGVWSGGNRQIYMENLASYSVYDIDTADNKKYIHFLLCMPSGNSSTYTVYVNHNGEVDTYSTTVPATIEKNYISNAEGTNHYYGSIRRLNAFDYIPNEDEVNEILMATQLSVYDTLTISANEMEIGSLSNVDETLGEPVKWSEEIRTKDFVLIDSGATRMSLDTNYGNDRIYFYDENKQVISQMTLPGANVSFRIPEDAMYCKWLHNVNTIQDIVISWYN